MNNHFRRAHLHVLPDADDPHPGATAYQRLKWRRTKWRLAVAANVLLWGALAALWIIQELPR